MAVNEVGKLNDPKELKSRIELAYEWIAKYSDGSELNQYDDKKGRVYHFGHIDQDKVVEFVLVSKFLPRTEISVNLLTGLFSINGKELRELPDGKHTLPLGLFVKDRAVTSTWGNKAKLIYIRHVRRDFDMGLAIMRATILYELGWEADVDGKHEKHTIVLNERGKIAIRTNDNEGFQPL